MRIEDALSQVRVIQLQVARTEQFCCYRWATVAASGALAIGAAVLQARWVFDPVQQLSLYLLLWVSVAAISVAVIGAEMLARWLRSDSEFGRRQTALAVQQFLPCLAAGAVATWAITAFSPEHAVLLPALWSILFSLGICASLRHLPAGAFVVVAHYLAAGVICIRWGQADQALQPWTMALSFGVGQLLTSLVLFRQTEPADEAA